MRILLTVDPEIPVPPKLYGGIERIADGLTKGYTEAGNEVFLIAHPDSTCKYTKQNFAWPFLRSGGIKNILGNMRFLFSITKKIKPDVVHSFSRLLYGYPIFFSLKKQIFVQSYQRKISHKSTNLAYKIAGKKLHFTSCASHMIKGLPNQQAFTPIFNFTDVDYFNIDPFAERTHLMYLGRIENIKGTKEAIVAAIESGNKIIVAGNIQPGHEEYFNHEIKPFLDNPLVQYVGPVNDEQKRYYLQRAKALLFPIKWEEPFGIVLAESLACGTPIIGFNKGSVQEIIIHNKNGFIVNNITEMIDYVYKLDSLSYSAIGKDAVKRFSLKAIKDQYLRLFFSLCNY